MERILAHTLLFLHLISAVVPASVKDVFAKLPTLVSHFQEHRQKDPNTCLSEFIALHYGEAFAQHSADHNHDGLPGKNDQHHHTGICACALQALPAVAPFLALPSELPEVSSRTALFQEQNLFPSSHLSRIWQPPKA